ncbi:PEGA domain-containing protein [Rheinheimera sp. UJ63]|uniref:PEGA domain-containing protein n=1 Tax=Rheinheimera sp. UJ63 TaxID=2910157 RepID=UPI001F408CAD|nr:PEGA domain-containing protein [Rheinheimera sp. UJ63]MCF4010662.1 SUMF1/EgtB/PvdO family nonheme iron enzyme [Rheinheimera sp. UJ63]
MSRIDDAIASDKRKRKWVVLVAVVFFTGILSVYLSWLFLLKGFTVKVLPAEAAQSQQFAVSSGVGFFIEDKFYLFGAQAKIRASASKFAAKEVLVLATQDSNLSVTLEPMPATVSLVTAPQLADISWSVNGQLVSKSQSFAEQFQPGTYQITAEHPFYQPASISVELVAADEFTQTLTLTQVQGNLMLASRPTGAAITIDGQLVGQTPLSMPKPGGSYQVELTLAGYEPIKDSINLSYHQPAQQRDYFLSPVQAKLTIAATPADGILLVNGKPAQSPLSLDAGKAYSVRYEKPGYLPQTQSITLQAKEQRTLEFSLKAEIGQVRFNANEVAEVFINGQGQGQTPLTLSLPALAQQVEFRKSGYRTVSRTVTPSSRQQQIVQAEMITEFAARRREGKPLFAETLGISFIGVQPKAYTMGSPPNETDRGRNEHQIKVDFSRNIWVSAHEITEAQYAVFSGKGAGSALPVTQVSWLDAVKFTNWLSEQEGLTPFYIMQGERLRGIQANSNGYRLLTEAEWEFIAKHNRRAARTTYVWGNEERLRAKQGNFADKVLQGQQTFIFRDYEDGFAGKAPVGSFKAERAGFFDLDGNVREWVHDYYALNTPNTEEVQRDYLGVSNGQGHVVKGASFKSGRMKELRASIRAEGSEPEEDIGFRIARYN